MRQNLFEIISYKRNLDDTITVFISDNIYIENKINVNEVIFEKYLRNHDRFYYETNEIVNGQLVSKSYELDIDMYFHDMAITDIQDDLYDFIICKHVDYGKAMDITLKSINSILTHFKI
jgi:hypothetical protein